MKDCNIIIDTGLNISDPFDNLGSNFGKEINKLGVNVSNSLIIGFALITCGLICSTYLHGICNLQIIHVKNKYDKEIKNVDNLLDLKNSINYENKLIKYYWWHFNIAFIIGIVGVSVTIGTSLLTV
jgi:hypothetical protein